MKIDKKGFIPIRDILTALQRRLLRVELPDVFNENHTGVDLDGLVNLLTAQDLALLFYLNQKLEVGDRPGNHARVAVTAVVRRTDPTQDARWGVRGRRDLSLQGILHYRVYLDGRPGRTYPTKNQTTTLPKGICAVMSS